MGLLWFVIIGAIAGWLAGQFMRGHGFGLLGDIVVGVIGAFIGRYISQAAGLGMGSGLIGVLSMSVAHHRCVTKCMNSRVDSRANSKACPGARRHARSSDTCGPPPSLQRQL